MRGLSVKKQVAAILTPKLLWYGAVTVWIEDGSQENLLKAVCSLGAESRDFYVSPAALYVSSAAVLGNNENDLVEIVKAARKNNVAIYIVNKRIKLEPSEPSALAAAKEMFLESRGTVAKTSIMRAQATKAAILAAAMAKNDATKAKLLIAQSLWPDRSLSISEIATRSGLSAATLYKKLGKRNDKGSPRRTVDFTNPTGAA